MVQKVREAKRKPSAAERGALVQNAISSMIYDPSGGRAIARLAPFRPRSPLLYLTTASGETREEEHRDTEEVEEAKKLAREEKELVIDERELARGGKSEKAKEKARAKKARLRANQKARAEAKSKDKGKGREIEKEQDWKDKGRDLIDKIFRPHKEDIDPNAPTEFKVSEFLNTISKHRIALPEEAMPNKPSSSTTPFPHPASITNDFVLAFERNTPGGTKDIPDIASHIWNREGEFGRLMDLFDLDFSHRQTQKFSLFNQDGVVIRKRFRITALPAKIIRHIFAHLLVPAGVITPYRYYADPVLRSIMPATGPLGKPDLNVMIAFCSTKNPASVAVAEEARNVLYQQTTFLFRAPADFMHFVSAIGLENVARLRFDKNILFSRDFFLRADPNEVDWLCTIGAAVVGKMLGVRSWEGGWEDPDEADGRPPSVGKIHRRLIWDEGKPLGFEQDGRAVRTAPRVRFATRPSSTDTITNASPSAARTTRADPELTPGAHFSPTGEIYHVDPADGDRELGVYDDGDGMGWYHVEFWRAKGCIYRWYESEMKEEAKPEMLGPVTWEWRPRNWATEKWVREKKEGEGMEREADRPESPVGDGVGAEEEEEEDEGDTERGERKDDEEEQKDEEEGDENEGEGNEGDENDEWEDDNDGSDGSSTGTYVEGWSVEMEDAILSLMDRAVSGGNIYE